MSFTRVVNRSSPICHHCSGDKPICHHCSSDNTGTSHCGSGNTRASHCGSGKHVRRQISPRASTPLSPHYQRPHAAGEQLSSDPPTQPPSKLNQTAKKRKITIGAEPRAASTWRRRRPRSPNELEKTLARSSRRRDASSPHGPRSSSYEQGSRLMADTRQAQRRPRIHHHLQRFATTQNHSNRRACGNPHELNLGIAASSGPANRAAFFFTLLLVWVFFALTKI